MWCHRYIELPVAWRQLADSGDCPLGRAIATIPTVGATCLSRSCRYIPTRWLAYRRVSVIVVVTPAELDAIRWHLK